MMRTNRKPKRGRRKLQRRRLAGGTTRQPKRRVVKTLFWLLITISLVAIFAPVQVGGQVGYIIVSGNSMLPNFQFDDLVLTWADSAYQLGEVVAYHDPILGGIVFHRIIAIEGSNYQTQGDNNSWLDLYRPTQEDIIGKAWLHLPGLGEYVLLLNQPGPFTLIVTAFVLMIFLPSYSSSKRKRT
jgi:signal peptidase I